MKVAAENPWMTAEKITVRRIHAQTLKFMVSMDGRLICFQPSSRMIKIRRSRSLRTPTRNN